MSQFKTKQFKDLQKQWYEKLKTEGFEDIEDTDSTKEFLKVWDSSYFKVEKRRNDFVQKEEYFYQAKQLLSEYTGCPLFFQNTVNEEIWALHSDGLSLRMISKHMDGKGIRIYKDEVAKRVNSIKKLMGAKKVG